MLRAPGNFCYCLLTLPKYVHLPLFFLGRKGGPVKLKMSETQDENIPSTQKRYMLLPH